MRARSNRIVNLIVAIIFLLGSILVYSFIDYGRSTIDLYLKVTVPTDDIYQVFYDTGMGFNEADSVRLDVKRSEGYQNLKFAIPGNIQKVRIDLGMAPGTLELKSITFKANFHNITWDASRIYASNPALIQIEPMTLVNERLQITMTGNDPHLVLNQLDPKFGKLKDHSLLDALFYAAFVLSSVALFILLQVTNTTLRFKSIAVNRAVLSSAFVFLLAVPVFGGLILNQKQVNGENRILVTNPFLHLNDMSFRGFTGQFESFINDHFAFRDRLIRWNNDIKVKWLGMSSVDKVIIGKSGWLFYNGDGSIEDYQGLETFSDEQLQSIRDNLEERKQWLAAQGIEFYVAVAPNKNTIYPEYLPGYIRKGQNITRLDQLLAYLRSNSDIEVIDLRPTLLEHKSDGQLYRKNDTHWNELGAFYGYEKIIAEVRQDLPGIEPLSIHDFKVNSTASSGDLSTMLMIDGEISDDYLALEPVSGREVENYTKQAEPYPDSPDTIITMAPGLPADSYTLLMFRDSFAINMTPYLSRNFKRSVYVWNHHFDANIIKEEHPDVVIHELVERFLDQLLFPNPDEMRGSEDKNL
ncbi:MAG: hypothetical protein P0Y55_16635 [Candidatus Cohnella colombiensis]|uniref:AlgX/AlgJ SGNH hydrolase-like domain-containing protein n=1 Tax=Candidatus Cohnella colombiensis TaxID=3121368 RepID=A0AA95EVF9_9BACL|nr:MAG: hypothetical protein P0Y55_16635 [Cohnella sp.]